MNLGKKLSTLVVGISVYLMASNIYAIQPFVAQQFCPNPQPVGKFTGNAVEIRLGQTFQGIVTMVLISCNNLSGLSRANLAFTFGNTSAVPNVKFNNGLGNPAPFNLAQPNFTYQIGPVTKTITSVTGQFFPDGKVIASFSGFDPGATFTVNWSGQFVGLQAISGETPTSEAIQDFFLQESMRFSGVVNPTSFLQSYQGGPVTTTDAGEVQFSRAGRGVMTRAQSAGDDFFAMPWGMWASVQRSEYEDNFTGTAFSADSNVVLLGLDVSPRDDFLAGVALGYEATDIESRFNNGGQDVDGLSIIPYMGGLVDIGLLEFGLDVSLGFSKLNIDQFRTSTTGGGRITSDTTSNRWFLSSNANVHKQYGDWTASGRAGITLARDTVDGFTETDGTVVGDNKSSLGRFTIGGDVAYFWNNLEPFANAYYEHDYELEELETAGDPQPANDNDDILFGAGIRWYSDTGLTAGFEYNTVLGRENFESDSFSLQLRADF